MLSYLHTMIRVVDLERSIHFYTRGLGFRLVSRDDYPDDRFTLAFLAANGDGDGGKGEAPMLELTHNWDTKAYVRGEAYGHVAYQVKSIAAVQARLRENGYDLSWGPGVTPSGTTKMAFVDDPDGFEIELLEHA
jgi:lactoylglutathione lyase